LILQVLGCIGMVMGFFFLFNIQIEDFSGNLFNRLFFKSQSIREEIMEETQRKKKGYLRREIEEVKTILKTTGREERFSVICTLSLLLAVLGAVIAALLGNMFLIPVAAAGCIFIPLWYVKLTAIHVKNAISEELETALSIITTAYLRSEDIVTSIEDNLLYLNPPVKNIFQEFVSRIILIDSDLEAALEELKKGIENEVFVEWVDALKACLYDRSLKTTLPPIVAKLSDMRIVNAELEYMVSEPRKEFITMVLLVFGNIPLIYFLNESWYDTLMHSIPGQVILSVITIVVLFSTAAVIQLTKPIEYRT